MDPDEAFALALVGPHAKASFQDRQLLVRRAAERKGSPLTAAEVLVLSRWHKDLVVRAASLALVLKGLAEVDLDGDQVLFGPSELGMQMAEELAGEGEDEGEDDPGIDETQN